MEILTVISGVAGITVIPMFGWVIVVERRLSRIEGYCEGKNCSIKKIEKRLLELESRRY